MTPDLAARISALRATFVRRCLQDCASMTAAIAAGEGARGTLSDLAHRMAGAGGTVGLPQISDAAAAVEIACEQADWPAVIAATRDLSRLVDELQSD